MKLTNKDKIKKLLQQRSLLTEAYEKLMEGDPSVIRRLELKDNDVLLRYLSPDKKQRIAAECLGMLEQEIEEIDCQLEKL